MQRDSHHSLKPHSTSLLQKLPTELADAIISHEHDSLRSTDSNVPPGRLVALTDLLGGSESRARAVWREIEGEGDDIALVDAGHRCWGWTRRLTMWMREEQDQEQLSSRSRKRGHTNERLDPPLPPLSAGLLANFSSLDYLCLRGNTEDVSLFLHPLLTSPSAFTLTSLELDLEDDPPDALSFELLLACSSLQNLAIIIGESYGGSPHTFPPSFPPTRQLSLTTLCLQDFVKTGDAYTGCIATEVLPFVNPSNIPLTSRNVDGLTNGRTSDAYTGCIATEVLPFVNPSTLREVRGMFDGAFLGSDPFLEWFEQATNLEVVRFGAFEVGESEEREMMRTAQRALPRMGKLRKLCWEWGEGRGARAPGLGFRHTTPIPNLPPVNDDAVSALLTSLPPSLEHLRWTFPMEDEAIMDPFLQGRKGGNLRRVEWRWERDGGKEAVMVGGDWEEDDIMFMCHELDL